VTPADDGPPCGGAVCGPHVAARTLRGVDDSERRLQANAALAETLLGQPKDEALAKIAAAGSVVRLVDWDKIGNGSIMLHSDLRPDRITLHVKDGIVTESDAG
jgi:hypothetical protein